MKKLFFTSLLFAITITAKCQVYASMSVGTDGKQPVISPSLGLNVHRFIIQGDLFIFSRQDAPVIPGLRAGYKFPYVQPSIGRYYILYSLDKYDMDRNGWTNGYFLKLSKGKIAIEPGYLKKFICTFSFTENIGG